MNTLMLLEFTQEPMPNSPSKADSFFNRSNVEAGEDSTIYTMFDLMLAYHFLLQIIMPSSVRWGEMNAKTGAIANSVKSVANSGNVWHNYLCKREQ